MTIKRAHGLALGLLLVVGIVMATSVHDDSLTTDETLYVPTGYMYLTEQRSRIGFEHPPLIREIAQPLHGVYGREIPEVPLIEILANRMIMQL